MRAPRPVGGVQLAGAEQVARQVGAKVHAQQPCQPDGEEAAAFGQVRLVGAPLPAQDGGRLRVLQQVVIGAYHQLVAALEQRLDGGKHRLDLGLVDAQEGAHTRPFFLRRGVESPNRPGYGFGGSIQAGKGIHLFGSFV